jgi:hypothetical protein
MDAKLSALEKAKLEVEAFENSIEILLSAHKDQSEPMDWVKYAAALPPPEPANAGRHEFAASLAVICSQLDANASGADAGADGCRLLDQQETQAKRKECTRQITECQRMRDLARRVLAGQAGAYTEAVSEFSSLSEIGGLGTSLNIVVHSRSLIGCDLTINGQEVVPSEMKSLTSTGKVSTKAMPKQRFTEIYQDYVCSCVLRVAREIFSLLPVETVLVTVFGSRGKTSRHPSKRPILSVACERQFLKSLDFETLDPSDTIERFPHRGDVRASRKTGEFVSIEPITPAQLGLSTVAEPDLAHLLNSVRATRHEIATTESAAAAAKAEPEKHSA